MYVDDTDILIAATHPNESTESIIRRTQHAADTWNDAITQTGGALRPEKCKWYLITFLYFFRKSYYTNHINISKPTQTYVKIENFNKTSPWPKSEISTNNIQTKSNNLLIPP